MFDSLGLGKKYLLAKYSGIHEIDIKDTAI
jgi:hypothetical protein